MPTLRCYTRLLRECLDDFQSELAEETARFNRVPWSGLYAPLQRGDLRERNPGWSFYTAAAEKVFNQAQKTLVQYPEYRSEQILNRAIQDAGLGTEELTPEDVQLLDMAIQWMIDGPAGERPAIGGAPGAPGGPFRSTGYGRYLRGRGAP